MRYTTHIPSDRIMATGERLVDAAGIETKWNVVKGFVFPSQGFAANIRNTNTYTPIHTFTRLERTRPAFRIRTNNQHVQKGVRTGGGIGKGVTEVTLKSSQSRVYLYAKRCCIGMIDKREKKLHWQLHNTSCLQSNKTICRSGFENRFKQYKRLYKITASPISYIPVSRKPERLIPRYVSLNSDNYNTI